MHFPASSGVTDALFESRVSPVALDALCSNCAIQHVQGVLEYKLPDSRAGVQVQRQSWRQGPGSGQGWWEVMWLP